MLYVPSVPLPRVILPILVGTTTASRNALRLASPDARMLHDERRQRRICAIYSQYTHVYAGTYVPVNTYMSLLMRAPLTRTHTWPYVRVYVRTARVCRANCMAEPCVHSLPQSVPDVGKRNEGRLKTVIPRYRSNVTRTHVSL